jgi:hypothetical protein
MKSLIRALLFSAALVAAGCANLATAEDSFAPDPQLAQSQAPCGVGGGDMCVALLLIPVAVLKVIHDVWQGY